MDAHSEAGHGFVLHEPRVLLGPLHSPVVGLSDLRSGLLLGLRCRCGGLRRTRLVVLHPVILDLQLEQLLLCGKYSISVTALVCGLVGGACRGELALKAGLGLANEDSLTLSVSLAKLLVLLADLLSVGDCLLTETDSLFLGAALGVLVELELVDALFDAIGVTL